MQKNRNKKTKIFYNISWILIAITFALSIVGIIFTKDDSQRSRFIFNAVQSLLFLVCLCVPYIIERAAKIYMSSVMLIIFLVCCFCHFILGEIFEFYVHVKICDSILHAFTGVSLSILSFSILNLMNDNLEGMKLSPIFVAFFAVFFSVTIGVLWEIIEYAADGIFSTNMQRYMHSVTLEPFVGREALKDTMKDLILDTIGATIFAVIGYFALKRGKNIFKSFEIVKNTETSDKNRQKQEEKQAKKAAKNAAKIEKKNKKKTTDNQEL